MDHQQQEDQAQGLFHHRSSPKTSNEGHRGPKKLPSGSQLPPFWDKDMDHSICHMEAQNDVDRKTMVQLLKRRHPELEGHIMPIEAIERRIQSLELLDNDYFKSGTNAAVSSALAKGLILPPYDPSNYPSKEYPVKSDLEVFGSGAPMTGKLAFGASDVERESSTRGTRKIGTGDKSKKLPARQTSSRNEDLGIRRVQLASGHSHPRDLANITKTYNNSAIPVSSSNYSDSLGPNAHSDSATGLGSSARPVTPVNSQSTRYFATPSSKDKDRNKREASSSHSNQHLSTPTSRNGNRGEGIVGTPSGGFYRSGKENAESGLSNTTSNASMIGMERPGMSTVMQRRRQVWIDQRNTSND